MKKDNIDFVILWVDGNDQEWQKEKAKYSPNKNSDVSVSRYRDWDNLQYWFRGVENFAPWVNKIHFVTYGHIPKWLNTKHPKVNVVKHSDFIPNEFLPTFNARPIELNLHRIEGLSERFVYFNDDMFLISKVQKTDFFYKGLPCDCARINQLPTKPKSLFNHTLLNNISLLNEHFNKSEVISGNFYKFFNYKYGIKASMKNLMYSLFSRAEFSSFVYDHLPAPYLKNTFKEVWKNAYKELEETTSSKFRSVDSVNQYIFRYWQFATGNFHPINMRKYGKGFSIPHDLNNIYDAISTGKYKVICINDNDVNIDFEDTVNKIKSSFNILLPEKSEYEI